MTAAFFNESHVEPVRELLRQGHSYREIAHQYGCDHHTVRNFVQCRLPAWHHWFAGKRTKPPWRAV